MINLLKYLILSNYSYIYLYMNFKVGSSVVNFCEEDIIDNIFIEKINTITSLAFVFYGLYGLCEIGLKNDIIHHYANINNKKICRQHLVILYLLLIGVGLGSTYFHSSLSEWSHWIDIIFISMILLTSSYYLNMLLDNNINIYKYVLWICIYIASSLLIPSIHIFLLFINGFYIWRKIDNCLKIFKNNYKLISVYNKLIKSYTQIKQYFLLGLLFWILDYFGCYYIKPLHTHWIFHLLLAFVAYKAISISEYLYFIKLVI